VALAYRPSQPVPLGCASPTTATVSLGTVVLYSQLTTVQSSDKPTSLSSGRSLAITMAHVIIDVEPEPSVLRESALAPRRLDDSMKMTKK
jgi:hypothetical protein